MDKLPLEKFHRLLDLVFWVKFLKLSSISLFVFFGEFYRVSLDPVACGALNLKCAAGGERPQSANPPRPTISDRKTKINLMIATLKQLLDVICKSISCLSFSNFIFFECVAIIKSVLI